MPPYDVLFEEEAERTLGKMDKSVRQRILKKAIQLESDDSTSRHLRHGLPYFVEEVGGYRIAFAIRDKQKLVLFVGDHKQYERWYRGQGT